VSPVASRWFKFNFVGAVGIAVQLSVFATLKGLLGIPYTVATALAVETAVIHNFVWHERFTWRGLPRGTGRDVALRLVKFHAGNGMVSILGNLALMRIFVGGLHLNPFFSNLLSIAACALVNFAISERFVFRR
jgi:putative flippase GtrA